MDTQYAGRDRRKYPRLSIRMAVVYQIDKPLIVRMELGNKEILATSFDLSAGGIAVSTDYDIPIQTILLIKFSLQKVEKDGRFISFGSMQITGEVRYNYLQKDKRHRLGIQFTEISQKDRFQITTFVEESLKKKNTDL